MPNPAPSGETEARGGAELAPERLGTLGLCPTLPSAFFFFFFYIFIGV